MQVYLTGKELEGDFFADTFADLIERLAEKDWVYKAEAVLSDYFAVQRKWGVHHHPLPERAFQEYVDAVPLSFEVCSHVPLSMYSNMLGVRAKY